VTTAEQQRPDPKPEPPCSQYRGGMRGYNNSRFPPIRNCDECMKPDIYPLGGDGSSALFWRNSGICYCHFGFSYPHAVGLREFFPSRAPEYQRKDFYAALVRARELGLPVSINKTDAAAMRRWADNECASEITEVRKVFNETQNAACAKRNSRLAVIRGAEGGGK